jgi:hypothetical protein
VSKKVKNLRDQFEAFEDEEIDFSDTDEGIMKDNLNSFQNKQMITQRE